MINCFNEVHFMKFKDKINALLNYKVFVWSVLSVALFLSAMLCASQVIRFVQYRHNADQPEIAFASETPAPTPEPVVETPQPSPTAAPVLKYTALSLSSSEKDIDIQIQDENGENIVGERFILRVTAPGKTRSATYYSSAEGTLHIRGLEEGSCTVNFEAQKGYAGAVASCDIKGEILREVVEVVEPVTTVQQVAEETKTNAPTSGEIIIADITTTDEENKSEIITPPTEITTPPQTTQPEPEVNSGNGEISFDSPGVQHTYSSDTYNYSFYTDDDGYLLLAGGGESSDVIFVQEEYGGAVYGLRMSEGSSESIELIYADGTYNTDYQIFAQPVYTPPAPDVEETPKPKVGWQGENGRTYYYLSDETKVTGLNRIDGKLYFFNPNNGEKASSLGIDVSYFNNTIDWNAVKNDGIEFAIIRVGGRGWSSGLLYDDTQSYENLANAKAAGIKIGVYFYSTAINVEEAIQEASLAIQNLHGIPLDMPIYFDTENSGDYPYGRSDTLPPDQQTEIARAFCDTVINSGYRAGVYSGLYYFYEHINYGALTNYNIWLANYTRNYALPNFAGRYDMWQFTDSGKVNGIHGYVDMNVIF